MPALAHAVAEETAVEKTHQSFRLARFVALLALDPDRLQSYLAEGDEEMAAAGLTGKEKDLLTSDGVQALLDYLWEIGPKPTPPDPESPPTGSSLR